MMTTKYKYPRTKHLPMSLGRTDDDKVLENDDHFIGQHVIITEKMDGENSSIYRDYTHARSLDSRNHPSRNWLKQFHSTFAHEIPEGHRICGENVFARHSVGYDNLDTYFYGFSYWEDEWCYDWDGTMLMFELLGITPVKVLFNGIYTADVIKKVIAELDTEKQEGFVVRLAHGFEMKDFGKNVAKYVREKHVQTDKHWMNAEIVSNKLKG